MESGRPVLLLARIGLPVALAGHWALQEFGDRLGNFWIGAGFHGLATLCYIYLCAALLRRTWSPSLVEAFGLVILLRLLVLPLVPVLSDDLFRYLHEGHMVLQGENPYLTAPEQVAEHLRLPSHGRINHPEVPAAYPPMVQWCLALGYTIHPSALGMKSVFGLCDLLTFTLLWWWLPRLGVPRQRALIYGLCPLVVLEFCGEAHSDSLAILMMVATLAAASCGRSVVAATALALATAGKVLPMLLLPYLGRRAAAAWLVFAAVLLGLYAPWCVDALAQERSVFDLFAGTSTYGDVWRHNDSLFHLLHLACDTGMQQLNEWYGSTLYASYFPHRVAKIPIALLGLALLVIVWRRHWPLPRVAVAVLLFFVAATPTMHPWYLTLVMPLLCLYPSQGLLWFTGTIYLAHSVPGRDRVDELAKIVEYLPFYLGLLGYWRGNSTVELRQNAKL